MLNSLIRFSLKYRQLIVFLCLATMAYGTFVMANLPIDVLPDLDRPRVVIITECPGYAPEDVETLITFPIEARVNGATGVESVRSQSGPGVSVVYVNFQWGTEIYTARQIVQERLNGLRLPDDISPVMTPISSLMGQILFLGLTYEPGPEGGLLASIPDSPLVGELIVAPTDNKIAINFWDPRNEEGQRTKDRERWKKASVANTSLSLSWQSDPMELGVASGPPDSKSNRPHRGETLLKANTDRSVFTGELSDALAELEKSAFAGISFRAEVTASGKSHTLIFEDSTKRQMALRTMADWVVRLRLLKVTGVAQVISMGGGRKQYQVLVDPNALLRFNVTLEEVSEALAKNNRNTSGGWAIRGDREEPIRFLGRFGPTSEKTLEQIPKIPIKVTEKRVILLEQVARVVAGPQQKRGDASINGQPGVVLMVTRQPNVDTRELTTRITDGIKDLEPSLPVEVKINTELFQMKRFIDLGVFNVVEALVIGAGLVLIVLFLFLLNFRTTFISLTAIPLSLAITAIVFELVGWFTGTPLSINVMTLGGIAVAMGELVDDAIVDVENIFRRLRENNHLENPRPVTTVIYEASVEVRSAIVYGTAMVILVFLPLFFLSGIEGRLFAPLGVAYIVSIVASLLVSLTVTPVMSYYLLPNAKATHAEKDSPVLRFLKWISSFLIRFSMATPGLILTATWVMVGISVYMLTQLGTDFLPPFDEGSVQVNVTLPPGASLAASNRVTEQVDQKFRELLKTENNQDGFILNFVRRTGRAELDEHVEPVSNTEYILSIDPESPLHREEILKTVLEELEDMKLGASIEAEQPLAHMISHMMTGVTAQIAIRVYGDDLTMLKDTAEKIKSSISDIPGIATPVIEAQQETAELHIRPRLEAQEQYGVTKDRLAHFVRTAMYGEVVSEVIEKERRFDLLVRLDDPYRSDYQNLERLILTTGGPHSGGKQLGMLAEIDPYGRGPNTVNRDNVRRRIVIRVNTLGRDLGGVVADIRDRVSKEVKIPQGYFVEYGGQFESQQRATLLISVLAMISGLAMFVVLYMLYPSWRIVLQILNALPTAFIGGVFALIVTGQTLTVASMVGFISLGGIAVRNGILLVSHYLHLMKYESAGFSKETILRGSLERLAPVLMTALTAGFALLPLVIAGQEPGREILYPVATVIFGGLITSTFCEFLVHPGIFWRFSGTDADRLVTEMEEEISSQSITQGKGEDYVTTTTSV